MPTLDELSDEVSNLNKVESNDFEFMDALDHIEEAGQTTDAEIDTLRNILNRFRLKLPNRETLNPDRVRAKDLAETLMLATLTQRIDRISTRNEALARLVNALQTQIDKANSDANRLKQIKEAVDKATKAVEEVKALVDQLTVTDGDAKDRLKTLIEGLANISSIFAPEDA